MSLAGQSEQALPPEVSVVICTCNRAELLKCSLESLVQQETRGRRFEIVVIDDGSTDHTRDIIERAQGSSSIAIRYFRQENSGIGIARNRGYQEAHAPWVAYMDDDELACKHWLYEILTTAEQTGADCVGGPYIVRMVGSADIQPIGTIRTMLGENPCMKTPRLRMSLSARLRARITRSDVPGSGNVLIRRKLLERLAGFRPMSYGEDLDLFRRATKEAAVFEVAHRAIIYHLTPASRLTLSYLYPLAKKGGTSRAEIDKRVLGARRSFLIAALRMAHMMLFTIPALLWHGALRHKSAFVARCCSVRFAAAYLQESLRGFRRESCTFELGP